MGFLCIDSMKVFESEEEQKVFQCAIEAAKAIGDSLYIYIEKILWLNIKRRNQRNITKNKEKQKG